MKIEKTEHSYHVTECDLKFGEQITLGDELLIPVSVLDKIKAEIERKAHSGQYGMLKAVTIIDRVTECKDKG